MALNIGTAAIAYVIIMILQIVVSVASPSQDALAFLNGLSTYITAVSPLVSRSNRYFCDTWHIYLFI
jgi:hypothetical protein